MLKIAIAGCGLIAAKKHIPAFLSLKGKTKIVAICDLNANLAQTLARRFHIKKFYTNFSETLLNERPDVVDICTPPATHAKLAIEAIEKGAHVFLEKPMATEIYGCDAMIEAANAHKKKICVMHNQIFNPAFMQARQQFERGNIGEFRGLEIFVSTPVDYMTSNKEHWVQRLPGQVLGETGPHIVYLAQVFLKNIRDIQIQARKILPEYPWSNYEDFRIDFIAENGIGSVRLVYGSNQWAAKVDIIGSKGILTVDLESRSFVRYNRLHLDAFSIGLSELSSALKKLGVVTANGLQYILGKKKNSHFLGMRNFVDSILEDRPPLVSAVDGRETVLTMDRLVRSLRDKYHT